MCVHTYTYVCARTRVYVCNTYTIKYNVSYRSIYIEFRISFSEN